MVWSHSKIPWHGEENSAEASERSKEMQTEEVMGIQHQRMDRNEVWRLRAAEDRERWDVTCSDL